MFYVGCVAIAVGILLVTATCFGKLFGEMPQRSRGPQYLRSNGPEVRPSGREVELFQEISRRRLGGCCRTNAACLGWWTAGVGVLMVVVHFILEGTDLFSALAMFLTFILLMPVVLWYAGPNGSEGLNKTDDPVRNRICGIKD